MKRAYKYKIKPTYRQQHQLSQAFGCARFIYNWGLDKKTKAWTNEHKTITYFELAKEGDPNAEWLTTANILMYIKSCARGSFQIPPANRFGRVLTAMPGMVHKTTSHGEVYLLRRKE